MYDRSTNSHFKWTKKWGAAQPNRRIQPLAFLCFLRFLLFQDESATIHPLFAKADWLYCRAGEIPADDRWYIAVVIRHLCLGSRYAPDKPPRLTLFTPQSAHQVVAIRNCPSAADGLNIGIARAETEWVVCVHQDVWLPAGWDQCIAEQLDEAERRFGPIGVAGVYGVGEVITLCDQSQPLAAERIGWVVDRGRMLSDGTELPAQVATLDELLLIVRRDAGLRFDPVLGFHLYGADICLQASEAGLAVVALAAQCHHNSRSVGLPEAFFASARVFARKWRHRLPVATPCAIIDRGGIVHVLGNATTEGLRSIAHTLPRDGSTEAGLEQTSTSRTSLGGNSISTNAI